MVTDLTVIPDSVPLPEVAKPPLMALPMDIAATEAELRGTMGATPEVAISQLSDLAGQLRTRISAILSDPNGLNLASTHNPSMIKALTGLITAAGKMITDAQGIANDKSTLYMLVEGWVQNHSVTVLDAFSKELDGITEDIDSISEITQDPNVRVALNTLKVSLKGPVLRRVIAAMASSGHAVMNDARSRIIGT